MGIHVEVLIRAPMDALWEHTQDPALHERWDPRFSTIAYLPREADDAPRRFLYATRVGFGMRITGSGESLGTRDSPDGRRTSSLRFASDDRRSLIREGSGYWKYIPTPDGIRFLTWYDYRTRFGFAGRIFDRLVFRPLLGWATALGFDRLRLWLERGIPPETTLRLFWIRTFARSALAFVFAYHGLVPKLMRFDSDELTMLNNANVPAERLVPALALAGLAELLFAGVLLVLWRRRWPSWLTIALMFAATFTVARHSPRYLGAAFNPVTLNLAVLALAVIDLLSMNDAPTAANCSRKPPRAG